MNEEQGDGIRQFVLTGKVPSEQAFTFKITPLPGRLMRADVIGKQITAFARLLRAIGDNIDPNAKFGAYLTGLDLNEQGEVSISVAVMPVAPEEAA